MATKRRRRIKKTKSRRRRIKKTKSRRRKSRRKVRRRKNRMGSTKTQLDYDCTGKTIVKLFDINSIQKSGSNFVLYKDEGGPDMFKSYIIDDLKLNKIAEGSFGDIIRGTSSKYPEVDFVIKESKNPNNVLEEIRILRDLPMYVACKDYLVRFRKFDLTNRVMMPHVTGDLSQLKNLNIKQIKSIIKILGQGLLCLADKDIFYFDIKAANVLFNCLSNGKISVFFGDLGSILPDYQDEYVATFPPPEGLIKHIDRIDSLTEQISDIKSEQYMITPQKISMVNSLQREIMGLKADRGFISRTGLHRTNDMNYTKFELIYSWQLCVLALQLLKFPYLDHFVWTGFESIDALKKVIQIGEGNNFGVKDDVEFLIEGLVTRSDYRTGLSELIDLL